MLSSICLIRHSFIFLQIYDYFVKPTRITVFFHENVFFEVFARMLLISLCSFCCLIFRLGGTGLGLTEEVEDVGDLHRGELLAVLAIPFASTSSWQFQGFAGTCLLPCLQLCFFPYLLPFLSGTCHLGGTGASWHQSQGLLSFLYRHQKTQKP